MESSKRIGPWVCAKRNPQTFSSVTISQKVHSPKCQELVLCYRTLPNIPLIINIIVNNNRKRCFENFSIGLKFKFTKFFLISHENIRSQFSGGSSLVGFKVGVNLFNF